LAEHHIKEHHAVTNTLELDILAGIQFGDFINLTFF
jgi:hypothetical protein